VLNSIACAELYRTEVIEERISQREKRRGEGEGKRRKDIDEYMYCTAHSAIYASRSYICWR
jgi:hypothetical protein